LSGLKAKAPPRNTFADKGITVGLIDHHAFDGREALLTRGRLDDVNISLPPVSVGLDV
jgi:hypothetical protein